MAVHHVRHTPRAALDLAHHSHTDATQCVLARTPCAAGREPEVVAGTLESALDAVVVEVVSEERLGA